MARVQNTLIGKSSGSVGGATFSTWKGINVLKSKAIAVANPQTAAQMFQRAKMTLMVELFRLIAGVVDVGFKTLAIGKSSYNAFVSLNIKSAISGTSALDADIDYPNLEIAKGTIGSIALDLVTGTNASANVVLDWDDALAPVGSNPSDIAYGAVYNATQGNWGFVSSAIRSAGTTTVVMPSNVVTADVLHAYLFFKSASSDAVSDSDYNTDTV